MKPGLFAVPEEFSRRAWMDEETYRREYRRSISDPAGFWAEQAERLEWIRRPNSVRDVSYGPRDVHIRWFYDGTLNASVSRPSPARMASPSPWTTCVVGRPRRSASLSIAGRSSWTSE